MYENLIIIPEIMPWIMLLVASSGIFVWRFLGVVLSSKIQKDSFFCKMDQCYCICYDDSFND